MLIPRHIAIIPDGNRRWAAGKRLAGIRGHAKGAKRFQEISERAFSEGTEFFTFWALSDENIRKRDKTELAFLLDLLSSELENEAHTQRLLQNNARFRVIGWWEDLFAKRGIAGLNLARLWKAIFSLERHTSLCDKKHLTLLLGYGGLDVRAEGATALLPDVDLVIRTGEPNPRQYHNSAGFLMRHTANAIVQFPDVFWPDFTVERFQRELALYSGYVRRFGA